MKLQRETMLEALYRRDRVHDGRYLVGVQTTRIYCLPSCPARKPRPEHVLFFLTQDAALRAGFRACKRCRPDLFYSGLDPDLDALETLLARMRADPARYGSTSALAAESGFGRSKLAALVREHYQTTVSRLLLRARLDAARRLLSTSSLATSDVGFAAGFDSVAAYYRNFRRATGLSPGDFSTLPGRDTWTLLLPRGWCGDAMLRIHGRDVDGPAERVSGKAVAKSFVADGTPAILHLRLDGSRALVRVECPGRRSDAMAYAAHALAVRLLGLDADPASFVRNVTAPRDAALVGRRPGLRVAQMADAWDALCWSIIGQQINLRFATVLRRRLIEHCGAPAPNGMRIHPTPADVATLDPATLRPMQFSLRKAEYVIGAARAIVEGRLPVDALARMPVSRARATLLALPGVGPWTTEYVMMRGLGFEDCVPVGDAGLVAALRRHYALDARPDAARTAELMAPFAPYRSLATEHFWQSLGDGGNEG
jgi:AraC family transcriptional regulator, regulatory protein of adaptative response / DNA-3-methyladenine glycosylase II